MIADLRAQDNRDESGRSALWITTLASWILAIAWSYPAWLGGQNTPGALLVWIVAPFVALAWLNGLSTVWTLIFTSWHLRARAARPLREGSSLGESTSLRSLRSYTRPVTRVYTFFHDLEG